MAFSALVFLVALTAFLVALNPGSLQAVAAKAVTPPVDQHFSNCNAARAAGRENIPYWDPSYRPRMDGDSDGWACEPYRGF